MIIRNQFKERAEDWLDYAGVVKRNAPFSEINNIYYSAGVIPNLHGDFQKGIKTDFFQRPAFMINERIFQVFLAGGFSISDNNPIVKEFFTLSEVHQCENKEEYKSTIDYFVKNPAEQLAYKKNATDRIKKEHLYTHRFNKFLQNIL